MSKVKVAINGYGTIGKRVADAVSLQDDMEMIGVAKTRPNYEATIANEKLTSSRGSIEERYTRYKRIKRTLFITTIILFLNHRAIETTSIL